MNDPDRRHVMIATAAFSAANITGTSFDASEFDGPASFQFKWSGIDGSDLTTPQFIFEESNDNVAFDTITAKTVTMTSAMALLSHVTVNFDILHANYYRVKVIGSDVTAGLIGCLACFKGRNRP